MARATVELDFFDLEKQKSASSSASQSPPPRPLDQRRNFRGIQKAIAKINPALLKSVIGSSSLPSTPGVEISPMPQFPVYIPVVRPITPESTKETTPMTIFYNGTITVFNVPHDKAENILKIAVEASSKNAESGTTKSAVPSGEQQQLVGPLSGDLPLFRRMSLQRFLEKRKARLTSFSPYACFDNYGGGSRVFGKKTTIADTFLLHPQF